MKDEGALWAEVQRLREDLDSLTIKRDTLTTQLTELRNLAQGLEQAHDKAQTMAEELQKVLTEQEDDDA